MRHGRAIHAGEVTADDGVLLGARVHAMLSGCEEDVHRADVVGVERLARVAWAWRHALRKGVRLDEAVVEGHPKLAPTVVAFVTQYQSWANTTRGFRARCSTRGPPRPEAGSAQ